MSANQRPRARFGEPEAVRAARLKAYKKKQRLSLLGTVLLVIGAVVGVAALLALCLGLGALVFLVAWNVGIVHLVAAAGGSVGTIGFWTALGGSLAVGILKGIVHGNATTTESK